MKASVGSLLLPLLAPPKSVFIDDTAALACATCACERDMQWRSNLILRIHPSWISSTCKTGCVRACDENAHLSLVVRVLVVAHLGVLVLILGRGRLAGHGRGTSLAAHLKRSGIESYKYDVL